MDGKRSLFLAGLSWCSNPSPFPRKAFAFVSTNESSLKIEEGHYLMRSEENTFTYACNLQFSLPVVIFKVCILMTQGNL